MQVLFEFVCLRCTYTQFFILLHTFIHYILLHSFIYYYIHSFYYYINYNCFFSFYWRLKKHDAVVVFSKFYSRICVVYFFKENRFRHFEFVNDAGNQDQWRISQKSSQSLYVVIVTTSLSSDLVRILVLSILYGHLSWVG